MDMPTAGIMIDYGERQDLTMVLFWDVKELIQTETGDSIMESLVLVTANVQRLIVDQKPSQNQR